jgi:hypothetical protein
MFWTYWIILVRFTEAERDRKRPKAKPIRGKRATSKRAKRRHTVPLPAAWGGGGFKYSGVGRESGSYGIEAFVETRAILES